MNKNMELFGLPLGLWRENLFLILIHPFKFWAYRSYCLKIWSSPEGIDCDVFSTWLAEHKGGLFVFVAKDGWPVERIQGHPAINFLRLLLHCRRVVFKDNYSYPTKGLKV